MNRTKHTLIVAGSVALLAAASTGCATKKHVRGVVAPIENKVGELEKENTKTRASIGQLENDVSRADERAQDADKKAQAAAQSASQAGQAAAQANSAADQARQRADAANSMAERTMTSLERTIENLDNYKLANTHTVTFKFGKADLTPEAQAALDEAVKSLANNKSYVLEVQGFTDSSGDPRVNQRLSQQRADNVARYLAVKHQVPLRRIHMIGVGEEAPVAENKTRQGREQNRRVEVKVYVSDIPVLAKQ